MKQRSSLRRRGFTYLDVLVAILLVVVLTAAILPAAVASKEAAKRARCMANLRMIGTAIKLYCNENNGLYPRTVYDPAASDRPTAFTGAYAANPFKEGGPQANDVTAPMFLLIRNEEIVPAAFVCPSVRVAGWDFGSAKDAVHASNWPDGQHLNYSFYNLYPSEAVVKQGFKPTDSYFTAEMPVCADGNPGGDDLLRLTGKSPKEELRKVNSGNHGREGQNVMYGDGRVEWSETPFCGIKHDNIYTFGPSGDERGGEGIVGGSTGRQDGVLLPVRAVVKPATQPARAAGMKPTKFAWDADAVRAELAVQPRDAYLQYVLMQLGLRNQDDYSGELERETVFVNGRREGFDLFSLFTGALAVQESLQLDAMKNAAPRATPREAKKGATTLPFGPQVKSHPWEEMLKGRKPAVSKISRCVPLDFYMVECKSLSKMLDAMDSMNGWSGRLGTQGFAAGHDFGVSERVMQQLAIKQQPMLRPFYDSVVEEMAVAGSDPFLREGSDVTLFFRLKQPEIFRARMAAFMTEAEKSVAGAKRAAGEIYGVKYVELVSPDRRVSVYACDPSPELHIRSNSKAALEYVLRFVTTDGKDSLGTSSELEYVRTLMPLGAEEEDVFIYLSDPFIRRLVGPQLKITERRRMVCYSRLKMLGHASMMFETEYGRAAKSIDELVQGQCLPAGFGHEAVSCPDGGTYSLSADGTCGVCSVHGRADAMTPCIEIPLENVTREEADEYKVFVEAYNQYWRHFFDPIAVRIAVTPDRVRAETIILPLIDNSIYTGLAHVLGGKTQELDRLPLPDREIFGAGVRLNKEELLKEMGEDIRGGMRSAAKDLFGRQGEGIDVEAFIARGLGDSVAFHVYDAPQAFGLDVPEFVGELLGQSMRGRAMADEMLIVVPLIVSLNSPVYFSVSVADAKVVDGFLAQVDDALAVLSRQTESVGGFFEFQRDFYRSGARRAASLRIGPVTWRFFWERIGDGFYVASKSFVLDDIRKLAEQKREAVKGHAMVRVRPEHFDAVLPEYQAAWAENDRRACLDNLSWLSDAARAEAAVEGKALSGGVSDGVRRRAKNLLASRFVCPSGGTYQLSEDGLHVTCSAHGSISHPQQPAENPTQKAGTMYGMGEVTAALTFMEDGLRAVVTIRR